MKKKSYQQLEEELAALRQRLSKHSEPELPSELILQTMLDGFILADSKGQIIKVNESYCRMTGFEAVDLEGSNIVEREALLSPEEVGHRIEWMLQTGHARFETQHYHRSGKKIPIEVSFSVIHRENDFLVAAFVQDLSLKYQPAITGAEPKKARLFPEAQDGMALISKQGIVLDVNPAFITITGIPRDELVNKKAYSLIKKFLKYKQVPQIMHALSNLLAGKPIGRLQFDFRNQILEVSLADLEWLGGITIMVRDVTREKRALDALHASELKFRMAFKSSSDAITISKYATGEIVEINEGFTRLMGYTWAEVKGKSSAQLGLWVDREALEQGMSQIDKMGQVRNLEARFRAKNGQILHGLVSANRIELKGEKYLISITRNIENLKRIEENLNFAQELGNIGSWEMDWMNRELHWSDQMYQIFELDHSNKPSYALFQQYIYPEDLEQARQTLRQSIKQHTSYELQHRLRLHNGKIKWVLETGRTLYDEKGNPLRSVGAVQDITRTKLAEEARLKSQRLFKSLATISPVGIFRADAKGNNTYVNPKWSQLSGISHTKALGDGWIEAVHPDDRAEIFENWKKLAGQDEISVAHYRFLHADGKIVYVKGQAVPEYDEQRKVIGYVGTITDITEQVLSQQVLEKAHNDLVQTLENMTDGFTSVDKNWRYLYVNRRAGEIFGIEPDELIGKKVWDVFPEMVGTDFYDESIRAMKTGVPVVFENYYAPSEQWFENRLVPTKEGLSTFFQDITPRKLANEQLREQEALLSTIARNYPNSAVTVLNPHFDIEFLGGRLMVDNQVQEENFKGKNHRVIMKRFVPQLIEYIETLYERALEGKEVEENFSHKGKYYRMVVLPLYFDKNKVTKILSIVEDVTQQKKYEEELKDLNENLELKVKQRTEKLEKSEKAMLLLLEDMKETQLKLLKSNDRLNEINRELESFSYSVSHDLKAPLRAIKGFGDFFKEQYYALLDEDGKKLVDDIIKNAEGMSQLIEGLLELSRTGRKELKRSVFQLEPVARSIFSEQKKYHNLPGAVLTIDDDFPDVSADYVLMKQLLANLFSNALKFSAKQKVQEVRLGWMVHENQTIYFVSDNGVGFDMRYANKMFDAFQRLHSRSMYVGNGIGLSIVKRIISKHGGEIWAEGVVDKGATIYFTLQQKDQND